MKRMELQITLTFAIIFVVIAIISGIESVSMQSSFLTFDVMADGLRVALAYLAYIWLTTRRHQLLICIGIAGILILWVGYSSKGIAGTISNWNWKDMAICICYIISFQIGSYQGKKLLEEDQRNL